MLRLRKTAKKFRVLIIVLIGLSAYQYVQEGAITWPAATLSKLKTVVGGYTGRPEAGWRKATDALNKALPAKGVPKDFDLSGLVVRVVDGNAISLLDDAKEQHTVRLHGVDTPMRGQPFSDAASNVLSGLVEGKKVDVETMEIDRFGRALGVLWLDGVNINLEMVKSGYASWNRQHAGYDDELEEAEKIARDEGRGLWVNPGTEPSWD